MPRITVKSLSDQLLKALNDNEKLREDISRLREVLAEQAELLRKAPSSSSSSGQSLVCKGPSIESHCPVCFEVLSDTDPILSCTHEICHKCCLVHFSSKSTCPLCRKEATPKELFRFRRPSLAKYWKCLRGENWPGFGDIILVGTPLMSLAGRHVKTCEEKQTITLFHLIAEWEIKLEGVDEIFTMQYLADSLPPREDGRVRNLTNA